MGAAMEFALSGTVGDELNNEGEDIDGLKLKAQAAMDFALSGTLGDELANEGEDLDGLKLSGTLSLGENKDVVFEQAIRQILQAYDAGTIENAVATAFTPAQPSL